MAKDWKLYALHILECIEDVKIAGKRGDIFQDRVLFNSVLHSLQILADATLHLPPNLKAEHPHVNWKAIKGFRNILVHDYLEGTDEATIRLIITKRLPELAKVVKEMLGTKAVKAMMKRETRK